jgi:hypothetical protein
MTTPDHPTTWAALVAAPFEEQRQYWDELLACWRDNHDAEVAEDGMFDNRGDRYWWE